MQQKQRQLYVKVGIIVSMLVVVVGLGVMLSSDIPVKQISVEKPLDAKTFLKTNPFK